jgi:DNA repair exonuclease SbcCD ATPase subunit
MIIHKKNIALTITFQFICMVLLTAALAGNPPVENDREGLAESLSTLVESLDALEERLINNDPGKQYARKRIGELHAYREKLSSWYAAAKDDLKINAKLAMELTRESEKQNTLAIIAQQYQRLERQYSELQAKVEKALAGHQQKLARITVKAPKQIPPPALFIGTRELESFEQQEENSGSTSTSLSNDEVTQIIDRLFGD